MTTTLKTLIAALALASLIGCQPVVDDDTVDADVLLEPFEQALEALEAAMTAHNDAVTNAADEAAIMAEEDAFATSAAPLFEECAHTAEELTACTGMHEDESMMPGDVAMMFDSLQETFAAHWDAMDAATDKADEEATFQAEGTLHMGHGAELHDDMHAHADEGELTCMMMGEHAD
mgnify:CR=1 FL=1